jgi:hypothetical protein
MTDTAPGTIDPLEDAKAELAAYRILTPADIMADLSPNACLFFLQQAAYAAMSKWGNTLAPSVESGEYEETEVTKAFFGIVQVCGELDQACVLVGILPPEALDEPVEETDESPS